MIGKKILATLLTAAMLLGTMIMPVFADTQENVPVTGAGTLTAKIGETEYETLKAAVEAAKSGDTITLLCNENGDGIKIPSGKDITIDFGGHTYTVTGELVGSPTYESQGFQLLRDSTITFKNGKITSAIAGIAIQNYSNLTLEDMTVELTTDNRFGMAYTISNNNGNTTFTGNTNIIASPNCTEKVFAFDVCRYSSYPSVTVTFDEKMTGTITGNVEISNSDNNQVGTVDNDKFNFIVKNGTINGAIVDARTASQKAAYPKIGAISGGTFKGNVSEYCAPGYELTQNADGTYGVKALRWTTDTDSGFYMDGETKYGMMRFMFKTEPVGTVTASGIKYIKASNIADSVKAETSDASSAFQGDIVRIPPDTSSENTYYAAAFITTEDGTFWSAPVGCSVNWNRYFTEYTGGVE